MSISRASLAAALVEYDNDDLPTYERKNHRQSALFSHLQPRSPPPPQLPSPVSHIPLREHDGRGQQGRQQSGSSSRWEDAGGQVKDMHDPRRSYQSGRSSEPQAEPEVEAEDVDVSRWDLPEHLVSTAPAKSPDLVRPQMASRSSIPQIITKSASTPVPHPESSPFQHRARSIHLDQDTPDPPRPSLDSGARRRTVSFELDRNADPARRRTHSTSEYLSSVDAALAAAERALALSDAPRARSVMGVMGLDEIGMEGSRVREPMMVPLPSSPTSMRSRPISAMSMSRGRSFDYDRRESIAEGLEEDDTPNPFALPAPPSSQASRFDPKFAESAISLNPSSPPILPSHSRQLSTPSTLDPRRLSQSQSQPQSNSLSHIPPLHPVSANIPEPSRVYADIPTPGEFGKPLLPSKYARRPQADRQSLLRPRTLIMPASLQGAGYVPPAKVRDGFVLGEKPLPAGARSSILTMGGQAGWQGGAGGVLPGQVGEVQQQGREFGRGLAMELQETEEEERRRLQEEEEVRMAREQRKRDKMPGKLYGTSLMDQLEARKQYTKNQQRVFTGDSRPSMFARNSLLPGSTSSQSISAQLATSPPNQPLISPPGQPAQLYPTSNQSSSPDKTRRQSLRAPLIQFDGNDASAGQLPEARPGMTKSRSVFGVDELWEKEMAKLKIIQAEEEARRAAQEQKEREMRESPKKKKGWLGGKDKKGKGKAKESLSPSGTAVLLGRSPEETDSGTVGDGYGVSPVKNRVGDLPPTLRYSPEKAAAPTLAPDLGGARRPASRAGLDGWSSDDEEGDARRRSKGKGQAVPPQPAKLDSNTDSEDDVPLSRIPISRPAPLRPPSESDSDEDVPLSRLAPRLVDPPTIQLNSDVSGSLGLSVPALPPSISPRPPTVSPGDIPILPLPTLPSTATEEDDDDRPLGLRATTSTKSIHNIGTQRTEAEKAEIEDDLPLGFKHANAVQRQVSGNSAGYLPMDGGGQAFSPYPPQMGWGMQPQHPGTPMGMGSVYGMGIMGYPPQPYGGHPGYGGMGMGMGAGMGMPQGFPLQGNGLPFLPSPQMPAAGSVPQGLGPPPLGPGGNIDSWRKGVRAPSTVGGEGGR